MFIHFIALYLSIYCLCSFLDLLQPCLLPFLNSSQGREKSNKYFYSELRILKSLFTIMASIGDPPKGPREKYPHGMTSAQANEWLNENISLPPYYFLETGILQDWIDYQNAAWPFQTEIR